MKARYAWWGLLVSAISGFLWFCSIIINIVVLGKFRDLSNVLAYTTIALICATLLYSGALLLRRIFDKK
ncbi:MAG: hypothetical protein HYT30_00085 [Parcubacteria group bacterium]|nr:hypothetical protein [Parcubacteria group bacterium]